MNGIPVLTGPLHQGLIARGEHLPIPCQGWAAAGLLGLCGAVVAAAAA